MEAGSSSRCGAPLESSSALAVERRCNPETGVGILSAVEDPAATTSLRVVKPARPAARAILEETPGICCRGYNCHMSRCSSRRPPSGTATLLSCSFCRRWIGSDGPIYVYKSEMGFCDATCRYDYAMQELGRRRLEAAAARARSGSGSDDTRSHVLHQRLRCRHLW